MDAAKQACDRSRQTYNQPKRECNQAAPARNQPEPACDQPLRITSVRVRADRIELVVRVAHQRYCTSDDVLVERCLQQYPTLGAHTCRNEVGPTFQCVMKSTSTPHILEHLIIDIETRVACNDERIFTGTTQWDVGADQDTLADQGSAHADGSAHTDRGTHADGTLQALVAVSFEDDVVALGAVNEALNFLNHALLALRG